MDSECQSVVELIADSKCNLGESPIYDTRNNTVYFVDINEHTIHYVNLESRKHQSVKVGDDPIGCIFLTKTQGVLGAATTRSILKVWVLDGTVEEVSVLPDDFGPDCRFNDGKVTPDGSHLIVGHMHSAWRQGKPGRLYAWSASTKSFDDITPPKGVGLPNGMVWNDGMFFFVDSCAESITEFCTTSSGIPVVKEPSRTVNCLSTGHKHVPDGMAIDSDGNLWVALGDSSSIVCYSAESGEVKQQIHLPIRRPTSCNFGGPNLETLFVTSRVEAGEGASPNHGGLFGVTIRGVKGKSNDQFLHI